MPEETAQANAIVVHSAKLSFIWAEVLPAFLADGLPKESDWAFLTRNFLFSDKFEKAKLPQAKPAQFEVPWIAEKKQQFWMRYLVQGKLKAVAGTQAWKYLVPLRVDSGLKVKADWFPGTTFIDAFYYPFGVAIAVTFRWEPNLPLSDLLPKAYEFYKNGKFSVVGDPARMLSLDEVADTVLTSLSTNTKADQSQAGYRTQQPFSLITIIEAEGVTPDASVRKYPDIMKSLEVLSNWPSDYEFLTLPPPDDVCLPMKRSAPAGSTLYAQERGRAVWHPELFRTAKDKSTTAVVEQIKRSSKLSCYHRNLLFASLQAESLGRLVCYTADLFNAGEHPSDLTANHRDVVHNAANCLANLYRGDKGKTWRSASVKRQIEQSCFKELKKVLAEFSEPPLVEPEKKPEAPASPANPAHG